MQRIAWVGITGLLAVACTTSPSRIDESELSAQQKELRGTIVIDGCTPKRQELTVTASRGRIAALNDQNDNDDDVDEDESDTLTAKISATNDPHVFSFRVPGAHAPNLYRLGASISPNAQCDKISWRGPAQWLAVDGQPQLIEGFAMRTQIEVLANRNGNPLWVGVDAIDLTSPQDAVRTVRWRTNVPGAVAGIVEVLADKPEPGTQQQVRVLASMTVQHGQQLPDQQGWAQLPPLDFSQLVVSQNQQDRRKTVLQDEIKHGAPIYIRVQPVAVDGTRLDNLRKDGLSSYVKIVNRPPLTSTAPPPPPPAPPLLFHTEYSDAQNEYASAHNGGCYRITKDHFNPVGSCYFFSPSYDPSACVLSGIWPQGTTIPTGGTYCVDTHGGGGFFSDVWDGISGFVDAFGGFVNDIAHVYEAIKKAVIKGVGSVISELGIIDCGEGSPCQAALEAALDMALASMGIPPTLPNWDQLKEEGMDYMVELAAEESGIDEAYIEKARELIETAIENAHTGGGGGLPDWITPDDGFRPMRMTITVAKNPAFPTPNFPNNLVFNTEAGSDYYGTEVRLPAEALEAGKSFQVPVQFVPNFAGLTRDQFCPFGPPSCVDIPWLTQEHLESSWYWTRNNTPCHTFGAFGRLIGKFGESPVILDTTGYLLLWQIPTHPGFVSDNPNQSVCP